MHDQILDLLIEYYLNLSNIAKNEFWETDIFEQKVYTSWAVTEIYNDIKNNPDELPIEIVEKFVSRMDEYSCKNKDFSHIFSIAYDTGLDILDQLLTMKEEEKHHEQIH